MAYCDPADLYAYGMPRGAAPSPGRLAGSVSTAENWIELEGHCLALNDRVYFRAESGGSLPSPLAAGTPYYAIPVTESHFRVSASAGGSLVDLISTGARVLVVAPLSADAAISWADRIIDDMLPAHAVPVPSPVPPIVRMTSAELACGKLLALAGTASRTLAEVVDSAQKRLERWAKGVPIRGTNAPVSAQLSAASAAAAATDSRGWRRYGAIA